MENTPDEEIFQMRNHQGSDENENSKGEEEPEKNALTRPLLVLLSHSAYPFAERESVFSPHPPSAKKGEGNDTKQLFGSPYGLGMPNFSGETLVAPASWRSHVVVDCQRLRNAVSLGSGDPHRN